ncbi:hypothetical protein Vretimale_10366 [Volvox reticuliferus]|uniref:Uncharacterized protein n=2 Tax=Volvox reticuliferus TaxID=1737510 RepID=A0A8J4CMR0_9CHLO|nr:hypothetical protein Vretifemale_4146 [Volvox reticuliferus]GIL83679.1 hypothetical protein Vretifemale_12423 [Volvox reticuliferus]GIL84021.1 hypothetical protein Vretifemale_12697 [Volvox reticuliferus]GIL99920.1 hypothetical protein Vretimale_4956 [Volvox reticuliferus]GIM06058.1 hypothetical protein Vretimale_10366 [Volvox reticuliferus]
MGKDKLDDLLDLHNYSTWRVRFKALCSERDLGAALTTTPLTPYDKSKSEKVINLLIKNVKDHHLQTVTDAANAKEAWDALAETLAANNNARRLALRQEFSRLKMEDGEALTKYIARARQLRSDLLGTGQNVDESDLALAILQGLPSKYEMLSLALTTRDGELDLTTVTSKLSAFETSKSESKEKESAAFAAVGNPAAGSGSYGRNAGGNGASSQRSNVICHYCKKPGHFIRDCRKRQADRRANNGTGGDNNNGGGRRNSYSYAPRQMAFIASGNSSRLPDWHLDSGSTWHVTYDESELINVRQLSPHEELKIVGVGGHALKPTAVGTLRLYSNVAENLELQFHDVYVAHDAVVKILSVGRLDSRGAEVSFGGSKVAVRANGETILSGVKEGDLYAIKYQKSTVNSFSARGASETRNGGNQQGNKSTISQTDTEAATLWHRRLGHLGFTNLEGLVKHKMVAGLDINRAAIKAAGDIVCEPCIYAKQTRGPFPSTGHKAAKPLQLLHMDVCGPMPEASLAGSLYVTTVLDDCTGLSAVAFTKTKEAVKEKVVTIINQLEQTTGHSTKEVRTDRGREFVNSQLKSYFNGKGIVHGTTVGYTPEQNGAAERLNRTLLEKTRAMLVESGLPKSMWAETFSTANYLRNISPVVGSKVTPYEAFFSQRPDVSHLRIFGCAAYVHVPKEKRSKLDPVSQKGTLVGYDSGGLYRVLLENGVEVCANVIFDETTIGQHQDSDEDAEVDGVETTANNQALQERSGELEAVQQLDYMEVDDEGAGPSQVQQRGNYQLRERKRQAEWSSDGQPVTIGRIYAAVNPGIPEPNTYAEAMAGQQAEEWQRAMDEEIEAQLANGTWELATPPPGTKLLPCRWVYKVKHNADGSVERFKARLVAKGYEQRAGIDYGELFAPTSRFASLRALLAAAAAKKMTVHQMDVSTAFLNGELKEELWMEQPPGYQSDDKAQACRLRRSIYGLKQAPRCWYDKLSEELAKFGLFPTAADPALFVKTDKTGRVYALVHVDDLLIASDKEELVIAIKKAIGACFKVRDLGEAKVYLGMEIRRLSAEEIVLSQQGYVEQLLERHQLADAKPRSTPLPPGTKILSAGESDLILQDATPYRKLIGELNYLATSTRPDISQALSFLARFMSAPTKGHQNLALGVLRYLSGTRELGLRFGGDKKNKVEGYSDSDWAGDPTTRRSTSGYAFLLNGAAISWSSQLQRTVAASSVEAEYQATAAAVREALWLRKLASELNLEGGATKISLDSQGALSLGKNAIISARSKHIDVHHHLVRERVVRGEIELGYCPTDQMVADILTKALGEIKFKWCRGALGVS